MVRNGCTDRMKTDETGLARHLMHVVMNDEPPYMQMQHFADLMLRGRRVKAQVMASAGLALSVESRV